MTAVCPTCHQPLPDQPRRDPPLPPLDAPAVVTIHDLPAEERARAQVSVRKGGAGVTCRQLVGVAPAEEAVDGREAAA